MVIRERLDNVKVIADTRDVFDEEMREPFIARVINPAYEKLIQSLGNLAPSAIKERYEILLSSSGTSEKMKVNNVLAIQMMLGVILPFLMYYLMKITATPSKVMYTFLSRHNRIVTPLSSLEVKI